MIRKILKKKTQTLGKLSAFLFECFVSVRFRSVVFGKVRVRPRKTQKTEMICPKRTSELLDLHLAPFKDKDPAWEIGVSKIAGRGVMATRSLKRGEIIFKDSPLLIGLAAHEEDALNACTVCLKELPDTKFMCRQGCGLPVCPLCAKKKQHKTDCDMFKSWGPNEPEVANSVIIRLLCIARAINLTKDQRDLIYCLQANLDNNHRTEVRNAAKCFKNFPTDKKLIEIMNRTVAVMRTNGFDKTTDRTNDNQEFNYRALYPLFGVMNHDCIPNSYYTFDEKTNHMIVRAAVDIPEGFEITTTYTKLFTGNIARHLFLKMKKGFTCKCPRCSDPTVSSGFQFIFLLRSSVRLGWGSDKGFEEIKSLRILGGLSLSTFPIDLYSSSIIRKEGT